MKKHSVIRLGVIGPGGAGRGNTLALVSSGQVELVAATDTNEQSLEHLENALRERVEGYKKNSFNRYTGEYEFIEMLNQADLDLVGVFSPHSLHDIHTRFALRANCHVLVEKPMANRVGDAIALTKLAIGRQRHLVIGYQRHFQNTYLAAKQALVDGLIGEVQQFDVYLAQRWAGRGWRGDPRFSGGGQPNDSGSHLQDIILWVTGLLPQTAYGTTSFEFEDDEGNLIQKAVEINSSTTITMENGATGTINIVGNTKLGFEEWIRLKGEAGILEVKNGVRFIPNSGSPQELSLTRPDNYPKNKLDQIIGLITGDYTTNYASGINGVRASWLTNTIIEAGKGSSAQHPVDCNRLLESEGYTRNEVRHLIQECSRRQMF